MFHCRRLVYLASLPRGSPSSNAVHDSQTVTLFLTFTPPPLLWRYFSEQQVSRGPSVEHFAAFCQANPVGGKTLLRLAAELVVVAQPPQRDAVQSFILLVDNPGTREQTRVLKFGVIRSDCP